MILIRSGDHPHRPKNGSDLGLTDELWKAMKACWKRRDSRWKISRVVSILERHCGNRSRDGVMSVGLVCGLIACSSNQ